MNLSWDRFEGPAVVRYPAEDLTPRRKVRASYETRQDLYDVEVYPDGSVRCLVNARVSDQRPIHRAVIDRFFPTDEDRARVLRELFEQDDRITARYHNRTEEYDD